MKRNELKDFLTERNIEGIFIGVCEDNVELAIVGNKDDLTVALATVIGGSEEFKTILSVAQLAVALKKEEE